MNFVEYFKQFVEKVNKKLDNTCIYHLLFVACPSKHEGPRGVGI